MTTTTTLDKLVTAIEGERGRWGGEGRRVFLEFDSRIEHSYDLTAREASSFLRSEKNREILRRRVGADSIKYSPSTYHHASGGGHDVGFVKYRTRPARRDPASVFVKFGEALGSTSAHATKRKTPAQLDREIADTLVGGDDEGTFYLAKATPTSTPLDWPELKTRLAAKRAAMRLVREGRYPRVEVWHRWRGDRYMQGLASEEGWSDV